MLFGYDLFVGHPLIRSDTVHGRVLDIGYVLFLFSIDCAIAINLAACDRFQVVAVIVIAFIIIIDCMILIKKLMISSDPSRYTMLQELSSPFLFGFSVV